jgi:hypothetical protein
MVKVVQPEIDAVFYLAHELIPNEMLYATYSQFRQFLLDGDPARIPREYQY